MTATDARDGLLRFWEVYARAALPASLAEAAASGMAHNASADEDDDERRRRDHAAEVTALVTLRAGATVDARHRQVFLETVLDSLRPAGRACLQTMSSQDNEAGAAVRQLLEEVTGVPGASSGPALP